MAGKKREQQAKLQRKTFPTAGAVAVFWELATAAVEKADAAERGTPIDTINKKQKSILNLKIFECTTNNLLSFLIN